GAAAVLYLVFVYQPKRETPAEPSGPAVSGAPPAAPEVVIEPRQLTGPFATRVEIFPQMAWPAYGTIASFYGTNGSLGIDIYVGADATAMAAARGNVVYAGPDVCCGYGFSVVVQHDGGRVTTYGRLANMSVKQSDRVNAGDTIGAGGAPPGQAQQVH